MRIFLLTPRQHMQIMSMKLDTAKSWLKTLLQHVQNFLISEQGPTLISLKAWLMILLLAASALAMTACAPLTTSSPVNKEQAPAQAMQKCPPLTPLQGKTGKELGQKLIDVGSSYNDCAANHNALVDFVNGN